MYVCTLVNSEGGYISNQSHV